MSRLGNCAALAGFAFVAHGGNHLRRGEPWDLFWLCNVAPLVLAIGCAIRRPLPVLIALQWLAFGTPMWLLDLATGGGVIWTSFLPHLLCPVVAVVAVRELGIPGVGWPFASAGMLALFALTRLVTPAAPNVNLAFRVWDGWQARFPRYDVYFALVMAGAALTFFVVERALARALRPPKGNPSHAR